MPPSSVPAIRRTCCPIPVAAAVSSALRSLYPIDTNVTINYRQLYAQALNAVAKGERYWLDDADEAILKRTNREFEQLTPLEQLFHSHFRAAEEDEEGNG